MGRLPISYAGKPITFRVPYQMPGELIVGPQSSGSLFADTVFSHQVDKPFEIHRMFVRLTVLDTNNNVIEPQPETLKKLIRLRVRDFSKNEDLTKAATLVDTLLTDNRETWDWEEPYTIVRAEGFQVQVDSLAFPTYVIPDTANPGQFVAATVSNVRVEVAFQGFLIVVAAPTETR